MPKTPPKLRDVYVVGVGMTPFARHEEKTVVDLGSWAIRDALGDAGLPFEAVEAAWCGHVAQGSTAGQKVVGAVGQTGIPVMNVENACASGTTAFRGAYMQVASGLADVALAVGFERMGRGASHAEDPGREIRDLPAQAGAEQEAPAALPRPLCGPVSGAQPTLRNHGGADGKGRREEPPSRRPEPARPVPGRGHGAAGAGGA